MFNDCDPTNQCIQYMSASCTFCIRVWLERRAYGRARCHVRALVVIGVSALHINDDLVVGAGSVVAQIRRRFGLPCRGDTQVVCGSKQSLRTTSLLYQVHGDNFYPNTVQYIPRLLLTRASRCLKCSTNHHRPWLQCRHQMMMIISWMIGQKHLIVRFSPERS
jgi:hypothetical protein